MSQPVIRVVAGLSFVAAGVLSILADRERWWPVCALGSRDSDQCQAIQSNTHDFLVPMEPWVPTGDSATLIGLSFLVLSAALVLMIPLAAHPWRVCVPLAVLGVWVAVIGYVTWAAGVSVTAVPASWGEPLLYRFELIAPLLILGAWLADTIFRGRESLAHHVLYGSLFMSTGLTLYLTSTILAYASHDTTPWNHAVGGCLFMVAGLVCLRGFDFAQNESSVEASNDAVSV